MKDTSSLSREVLISSSIETEVIPQSLWGMDSGLRLTSRVCLLLLVVFLGTACGGAKLKELEDGVNENRDDIADIRTLQADVQVTLDAMRADMRRLSGMVEELDYLSRGKAAELQETLERFSSRVPPPAGVPENLLALDEEKISSQQGDMADVYRQALKNVRLGNFTGAIEGFNSFVEANPATSFTDNALFWLGVSHEKLGQYDRAILSYSEVFENFPAEDRVSTALFRLGDVFFKIKEYENAQVTFQKIVDDYAGTQDAAPAKAKLDELRKILRRRK